jgi:hypothetical protein
VREWAVLGGPTRLTAPWNVATLVAAASAALAGRMLAGADADLLTPAAAVLLAALPMGMALRTSALAAAAGAAALLVLLSVTGAQRPVLALLPWVAVVGTHALSRGQTLDAMGERVSRLLRRAVAPKGGGLELRAGSAVRR